MSTEPDLSASDAAFAAEADCLQWKAVTLMETARRFLYETLPERLRPFADWQIANAESGFSTECLADEMRSHNDALPDEIRLLAHNVDVFFADE